jgi:glycosyltransferase involved in cell wall biosynthesis
MSQIKLSIITPCFNPGAALRACIESVSRQVTPEIEHLVQDARSTDGSLDYLRKAEAENPHLTVVSEKDSGQSNAMNRAIPRCRGEYIGILNADDCYEDGALAAVLPELYESGPQPLFLHGNLRVVNDITGKTFIQSFPRLHRFDPYFQAFPWNPAAYFYSKRLHDLVGWFDEKEHFAMDVKFMIRAFRVAELRYLDRLLGTYFIHPGAKTHDDIQAGVSVDRLMKLVSRERAQRPWGERLQISMRGARRNFGYQKHLLLEKFRGKRP